MIKKLRNLEDSYMELFCKINTLNNRCYFSNQIVPEMYDHNFILIQDIIKESETIKLIVSELEAMENSENRI